MSYGHLPAEERMQKASEYALLCIQEELPRPEQDIVQDLKDVFSLTEAEAIKAFALMKTTYNSEYKKANISHTINGVLIIIIVVIIGLFYFFLGDTLSWGFYLLSIFFFLLALATIGFVGIKLQERFIPLDSFLYRVLHRTFNTYNQKEGKYELHWTASFLIMVVFFIMLSGYAILFKTGVVDVSKIIEIRNLTIGEDIFKDQTGGKNSRKYYVFQFINYPNKRFRFLDEYYRYGNVPMKTTLFKKNEIVNIEVERNEYEDLINNRTKNIDFVNIYKNGRALIDLNYRNDKKMIENKHMLYYSLAAFVLFSLMILKRFLSVKKEIMLGFNIHSLLI